MNDPQSYQLTNKSISTALSSLGIRNVAWSREAGESYYQSVSVHSKSLARLALLAENDLDLIGLLTGWLRVHLIPSANEPIGQKPLQAVVVIEDLPPLVLDSLEKLQRQGLNFLVVLADSQRTYLSDSRHSLRRGPGWPGPYARARGLQYPDVVEASSPDKLARAIERLVQLPGIKILQVVGGAPLLTDEEKSTSQEESVANISFDLWAKPEIVHSRNLPLSEYTFETLALMRMTKELINASEVICLWARSEVPEQLTVLRKRFQRCSLNGLLLQAVGMAAAGCHPLVVVSASSLPHLLPDLMEIAPFPITFLIMDAGLASSAEPERPTPAKIHDLSLLRNIGDMTIAVPSDEEEARGMLQALLALPTPGALRLTNSPAVGVPTTDKVTPLVPGKGRQLRQGQDISFVCLGRPVYHALLAAEAVNSWGYKAGVCDMRYLQPLDLDLLAKAASTGRIVTVEEHSINGGLGTAVLEALAQNDPLNPNQTCPVATTRIIGVHPQLQGLDPEDHGISIDGITQEARRLLNLPLD